MFYNVWCNSSLIAKQWFDLLIFFNFFFIFWYSSFFLPFMRANHVLDFVSVCLQWSMTPSNNCMSSSFILQFKSWCHSNAGKQSLHIYYQEPTVWVRSLIAIKYSSSPFMLVFACLLLVSSSWLRVSLNFAFTFQELHMVSTWMRVAANVPINLLIIFSINWLTVLGSSELHVISSS